MSSTDTSVFYWHCMNNILKDIFVLIVPITNWYSPVHQRNEKIKSKLLKRKNFSPQKVYDLVQKYGETNNWFLTKLFGDCVGNSRSRLSLVFKVFCITQIYSVETQYKVPICHPKQPFICEFQKLFLVLHAQMKGYSVNRKYRC